MKTLLWSVILLITLTVNVQARYPSKHTHIAHDGRSLAWSGRSVNSAAYHQTLVPRLLDYIAHIDYMTAEAKHEMRKSQSNTRPSTLYSVNDLIFTVTSRLPVNVYPTILWKQDSVTRRRQINKAIRSTVPVQRMHLMDVRNDAHIWTKEAASIINNEYLAPIAESLDDLSFSLQEHFTKAIDRSKEIVAASSSTSDMLLRMAHDHFVKSIERESNTYMKNHDRIYKKAKQLINSNFNNAIVMPGKLRRPLESIRHDALKNTDLAKSALRSVLEKSLHDLPQLLQTRLATYRHNKNEFALEFLQEMLEEAFVQLRTQIVATGPSFGRIWDKAGSEIYQHPVSYEYWLDTMSDIKNALNDLGHVIIQIQKAKVAKVAKLSDFVKKGFM